MQVKSDDAYIAAAERVCAEKGERLTPLRKTVMRIISQSRHPVKAYDIMDRLSGEGFCAKPPTVYRTLDFLIKNGIAHKVSTMSAYVACPHADKKHAECFLLLCSVCGEVKEFCGGGLSAVIDETLMEQGFQKNKTVLEVSGVCQPCGGGNG